MSARRLAFGAAFVAIVAAVGFVIFLAASASCPKGEHEVFDHYQPVITIVNKTPIVQEIPIYRCSR